VRSTPGYGASIPPGSEAGQITVCWTDISAQFLRLAERSSAKKIKSIQQVALG
jgi:hypothetical protein